MGTKGDWDFRISDLVKKNPWWNWYLTPGANFGEVRRTQLAKSTLLTSTLVALWSFSDLLKSVQMLKREWVTGSYRTYSSIVKPQPRFLSLQWKTCLWEELQPWCLSLQWRTCPWAEHMMMILTSSIEHAELALVFITQCSHLFSEIHLNFFYYILPSLNP